MSCKFNKKILPISAYLATELQFSYFSWILWLPQWHLLVISLWSVNLSHLFERILKFQIGISNFLNLFRFCLCRRCRFQTVRIIATGLFKFGFPTFDVFVPNWDKTVYEQRQGLISIWFGANGCFWRSLWWDSLNACSRIQAMMGQSVTWLFLFGNSIYGHWLFFLQKISFYRRLLGGRILSSCFSKTSLMFLTV